MSKKDKKIKKKEPTYRSRSKGGIGKQVLKVDCFGGNWVATRDLIETLIQSLEDKFAQNDRYKHNEELVVVFDSIKNFLEAILSTKEEEARDGLFLCLGRVIQFATIVDKQEAELESLKRQTNLEYNESVRDAGSKAVLCEAETFMKGFISVLQKLAKNLGNTISEYKKISVDLGEFQDEIFVSVEEFQGKLKEKQVQLGVANINEAIYMAKSRALGLENRINEAGDTSSSSEKNVIKLEFNRVKDDLSWLNSFKRELDSLRNKIDEHNEIVRSVRNDETEGLKSEIEKKRNKVRSWLNLFQAVGQEGLFWSCVYGLQANMDFAPEDMLIYQINLDEYSLPTDKIDEYIKWYQRCSTAFEKLVGQKSKPKPASEIKTVKKKKHDQLNQDKEEEVLEREFSTDQEESDRIDKVGELIIMFLWAFVLENRRNSEVNGKRLLRNGNYPKNAQVVKRILVTVDKLRIDENNVFRNAIDKLVRFDFVILKDGRNGNGPVRKQLTLCDQGISFAERNQPQHSSIIKRMVQERNAEQEKYQKDNL